jgi:transcription initiation factor TFIIIB Brf1 subunit/transcription initiation factor TFIIB
MLEHMVCRECGAVFNEDLFSEDPSETIVCPLCGTVALDAEPIDDHALQIHVAAAAPAQLRAPRLSA